MTTLRLYREPAVETALILAPDPTDRQEFEERIREFELELISTGRIEFAIEALEQGACDVCLIIDAGAEQLAKQLARAPGDPSIICVLPSTAPRVDCDPTEFEWTVLSRPVDRVTLQSTVAVNVHRTRLVSESRKWDRQRRADSREILIGQSGAMEAVRRQIRDLALDNDPVRITGEPGAEIDQAALALHMSGDRADGPFVTLDCRLHPTSRLTQEFFGSTSGTAVHSIEGRWHRAIGGTLFVKSPGALSVSVQQQLADHLASAATASSSPRLVFGDFDAGVKHFENSIVHSALRTQLADRVVAIPPLRLRPEDSIVWAEHLLTQLASRHSTREWILSPAAADLIRKYYWPGNVAELEAALYHACLVDGSGVIDADHLMSWLRDGSATEIDRDGLTLRELERRIIETTFARCGGNRERTARVLQIGVRTLSGKLREYGYPPRGGPGSNQRRGDRRVA